MTSHIVILLCLLVVAIAFFWRERIPSEVVALGLALALVFTGLVPAQEAFAGFGSDTVVMIVGLLVLTAALERTGMVELLGRLVLRRAGANPDRLLWLVMVGVAGLSSVLSNTAATAFFLPLVFGVAQKSGLSVSKLLLPLAFSSILTSSVTLVSSSTNIVVSGILVQNGHPPMGMFEMAPVGLTIALVGLFYVYFARRFIPDRGPPTPLSDQLANRPFLSEVVIMQDSKMAGQTLQEAALEQQLGLTVVRVIRDKTDDFVPSASTVLAAGDILLVAGNQEDLVKIKDVSGLEILADVKLYDPGVTTEETMLAEVALMPGSPLIGRTLQRQRFKDRFGLQVLGINHQGMHFEQKLSRLVLRLGDVLLVQGRGENIARLHQDNVFKVLGRLAPMEEKRPRLRRAPVAIAIYLTVILLAGFQVLPLPLAVALGAFLTFLSRCLTPAEAYDAIEWKAVLLIGCMLGLATAMENTGAAKFIASQLVSLTGPDHPFWLLTVFFALTVFLTQPMSNQAAAIVALPIALQTAAAAGLNPRTFAVMIAVAASCSYLTPLEPSCLMVYGPGRYRFTDFIKIGSLLTVLIYVVAILLVPRIWPL